MISNTSSLSAGFIAVFLLFGVVAGGCDSEDAPDAESSPIQNSDRVTVVAEATTSSDADEPADDDSSLPAAIEAEPPREPFVADPDFDDENSIGMKFVLIPAGEFRMGTEPVEMKRVRENDSGYDRRFGGGERPAHRVVISRPFLMSIYEVTRGDFRRFVDTTGYMTAAEIVGRWQRRPYSGAGAQGWDEAEQKYFNRRWDFNWRNTGYPQTDRHPVGNVTYADTTAFCNWLSEQEGQQYRLPSEAEWEYACRAGTRSLYHNGDDFERLSDVANVADASYLAKMTHLKSEFHSIRSDDGFIFSAPVGMFHPNAWGLFDMHGNISEMCEDLYTIDYYANSPEVDPTGPATNRGSFRVHRGGGWRAAPGDARSGNRFHVPDDYRYSYIGFRVVIERE